MKRLFLVMFICLGLCCGCSGDNDNINSDGTISYTYAKELIINENAILVDVRTEDEYNEGHIEGAKLLTLDDINEDSASDVIDSMDAYVIVYCKSGNRSNKAMRVLNDLGYDNVYDLGAMSNWEE